MNKLFNVEAIGRSGNFSDTGTVYCTIDASFVTAIEATLKICLVLVRMPPSRSLICNKYIWVWRILTFVSPIQELRAPDEFEAICYAGTVS